MATALITGASMGLGADFAQILAEKKTDLILVARSLDRLQSIAQKLTTTYGIKCEVISFDLARPNSAQNLFDEIKKRNLQFDILVNNAGYGQFGAFFKAETLILAEMMQLNMNTLAELTRLALPEMIAKKSGKILNVASIASFLPGPWMAVYYATKAFVLSLGEALSVELEGTGVTITTLCPGPTQTEFFSRAKIRPSKLTSKWIAKSLPCARKGIEGMEKGVPIVIDNWVNWSITFILKFLPKNFVRSFGGIVNRGKRSVKLT